MSRCRAWTWPDTLYDVLIVLLQGSGDDARRWMDRKFGDVSNDDLGPFEGAGGKAMWVERDRPLTPALSSGCALVVWVPEWFDARRSVHLGVLAHESFHGAEFVMRERGLTLSDASDEAYAYYVGWVFEECHKRLTAK